MISKECFTTEWIAQKSVELQYNDKNLIEKVIRAFALLEMLSNQSKLIYNIFRSLNTKLITNPLL